MTTYYRWSNEKSPMSDWGHAMFATNNNNTSYGNTLYTYDGNNSINIRDLEKLITETYQQCLDNDDFKNIVNDEAYLMGLTAEEVYNSFNPKDIVDSADGWDNCELLVWFWNFIAEPNDIKAIITNDGAIVFDETLITKTFEFVENYV